MSEGKCKSSNTGCSVNEGRMFLYKETVNITITITIAFSAGNFATVCTTICKLLIRSLKDKQKENRAKYSKAGCNLKKMLLLYLMYKAIYI